MDGRKFWRNQDGGYLQYGLNQGDGLPGAWGSEEHIRAGTALPSHDPLHRLPLRGVQVPVEEVPSAGDGLRQQSATWR